MNAFTKCPRCKTEAFHYLLPPKPPKPKRRAQSAIEYIIETDQSLGRWYREDEPREVTELKVWSGESIIVTDEAKPDTGTAKEVRRECVEHKCGFVWEE